jgi:uncharacterized protein YjiS (DUF1127 family)
MTQITASILTAMTDFFRRYAARRARRLALRTLLEMDPWRLDDLGIDRQDVVAALTRPSLPGVGAKGSSHGSPPRSGIVDAVGTKRP